MILKFKPTIVNACLKYRFRLVIVADKRVVYEEFPIPLINRMEKHFLTMKGMLTPDQLKLSEDLDQWARKFSKRYLILFLKLFDRCIPSERNMQLWFNISSPM